MARSSCKDERSPSRVSGVTALSPHTPAPSLLATTEKAKILDSNREVVGLHKQRYVFPIIIHVTKASGAAADSIFLGTIKVGSP